MVSIIIPTLNRADYVNKFLDGICDQIYDLSEVEVIVVDSFSSDGTYNIVKEYSNKILNPKIRIFQIKKGNIAAARNLGIQKSFGKIIVFLDSDCYPITKNWLQNLVNFNGPEEIIFGRIVVPSDTFTRRFIRTLNQMGTPDYGDKDIISHDNKFLFFPTTNVSIRKQVFNRIGLLDENIGSSREDWDFSLRVKLSGIVTKYASNAIILHEHRDSLISLLKGSYDRHKGSVGFLRKYGVFGRFQLPIRDVLRSFPIPKSIIIFATIIFLISCLYFSIQLFINFILFFYFIFLLRFLLSAEKKNEIIFYPIIYAINIFLESFGTFHALLLLYKNKNPQILKGNN